MSQFKFMNSELISMDSDVVAIECSVIVNFIFTDCQLYSFL